MAYRVGLAAINVPPESKAAVQDCLQSGDIGQSVWVERFERELARWAGVSYAIATSSGTMADAVALAAMRERYGRKAVICPALTFIAQPNAARYVGMDVHFADVTEYWEMDREQAYYWADERTGIGLAIAYPSDIMGRVSGDWPGVPVVEDACEAFGSKLHSRRAGTFGKVGTYSFFISHSITTGEGGAIVTDDAELAELCRSIRSHGRASDSDAAQKFVFPRLGLNAKMSGLTAAFGLGLMKHADEYIQKRRDGFLEMRRLLGGFEERPGEQVVPHGYPVEFESETARDAALLELGQAGIECRKFFSCIPTMEKAYAGWPLTLGGYPVAEHIARTHLYTPCHQNLDTDSVRFVADVVNAQKGLVKRQ